MAQMLVLSRFRVPHSKVQLIDTYRQQIGQALQHAIPGFTEPTVWRSTKSAEDFMMLNVYSGSEAATRAMDVLTATDILPNAIKELEDPIDITRVQVAGHHGSRPSEIETGQYMSMSVREADPGYGKDLLAELGIIFEELTQIDGYLGSARGHNESVEEEVVGLVFWRELQSFEKSLPHKALYEVEAFLRV